MWCRLFLNILKTKWNLRLLCSLERGHSSTFHLDFPRFLYSFHVALNYSYMIMLIAFSALNWAVKLRPIWGHITEYICFDLQSSQPSTKRSTEFTGFFFCERGCNQQKENIQADQKDKQETQDTGQDIIYLISHSIQWICPVCSQLLMLC